MSNRMKACWARGEVAIGAWSSTGSPFVAELLALSGFHYVCLDQQHGLIGYETLVSSLYAVARTDATPITRVPANDPAWIGKSLDAGAEGVIVPMVNTAEEAERAVAACRYHPDGTRSFGSLRGSLGSNPAVVNREVACIVMIETEVGVSNAAEICAVPGVDAVFVGPADLALSLGLAPGLGIRPGRHAEAIDSILAACADNGVVAGIFCGGGDEAAECAAMGFKMVVAASDTRLLRVGVVRELERATVGICGNGGASQPEVSRPY